MNKIDLINCLFLKVITLEDSKIDKDCWQNCLIDLIFDDITSAGCD